MEHDEASRHQTGRTKMKIRENLGLLKDYLEKHYNIQIDDDAETVMFNALDWTADDVYAQCADPATAKP